MCTKIVPSLLKQTPSKIPKNNSREPGKSFKRSRKIVEEGLENERIQQVSVLIKMLFIIFQTIRVFAENTSTSEKVSISQLIKENIFIWKGKIKKNLCKHWKKIARKIRSA